MSIVDRKTILCRGGRTGRKIHEGHKGSTVTYCGHWTKRDLSCFKVADYDGIEKARTDYGPSLCEKCFPPELDERRAEADRHRHFFAAVEPADDWRGPIDAVVTRGQVDATVAAIHFFTATECKLTDLGNGTVRIESVGYRLGPAGDH